MLINVPNIDLPTLLEVYIPVDVASGFCQNNHQGWVVEIEPTEPTISVARMLDDLRQAGLHPSVEIGQLTHQDGLKFLAIGCKPSDIPDSF